MPRLRTLRLWASAPAAVALACACALPAAAQSIEPRAYAPAPTGVNFLLVGYAHTSGGLSFDESIPIADAKLTTQGPLFAYARTFSLWGRQAKFDAIAPTARLEGSAVFQGQPVAREVQGMGDPLFRVSAILAGARALGPGQFRGYRQDLVVGASLQVGVPLGQYDETRLLNLGAHRWTVKPEIGVSKALGRWTAEAAAAVTLFGDNDRFFGGVKRTQEPLYGARGSLIYGFRGGAWASLDATFYTGGRSTVGGTLNNDLQQNWRAGATLALPVTPRDSLKLYASRGLSARTGNGYDLIGVVWQRRWGAGI